MEKEKNGSVVSERSRITGRDARDDERRNSRRESREDYEREDLTRKGTKNSRDFKAKSKSNTRRRYNSDSSSSESESTVSERSRKVTVNDARDEDDRRSSKRKSRVNSERELDERDDLDRIGEKSVKNKRDSKSREYLELDVDEREQLVKNKRDSKSKSKSHSNSKSRRLYDSDSSLSESESSYSDDSDSRSDASESETDEEERRRRRKKRKRREEEKERERRRRREKQKKKRKEKDEKTKKKKKKKKDQGSKGAVTNSWGKYGIIREQDMWNKRPEFTAWLMEVKQVNLEHLPNWEEKQMFKQFMEDHNTATFPSKKYYNLDAFYRRQLEKEVKKGSKKVEVKEMTVFNDEEQRRLELMKEREKRKEEEVETLKRSMQSGMAQAMKEQAQLREEMALLYKLGHSEAAAAIQRRLDPDVPM